MSAIAHSTTDDIVAIRALADRYSDAANRLDTSAMADVYAIDGELVAFGNSFHGRDTIRKVFEDTIGLREVMNQVCSGAIIEVSSDRATARWNVTEFAKRRDLDKLDLFIGNYEDELVRTAEGWRFARRVLTRRAQARFDAQIRI